MKLLQVLENLKTEIPANLSQKNPDISDLRYDSRLVKGGELFFAIPGTTLDGFKFAESALSSGALACVVDAKAKIPAALADRCITVGDVRVALAEASANFFDHPCRKMLTIGITGTKGKTSSSFLVESIFAASGKKTALLGTVECHYPGFKMKSERTTMESYDLQKFLRDAQAHGAEVAVLEVSSHALSLARVAACQFDGMIFTNLSEDHLDFYGDMEKYYQAKRLLFTHFTKPKNGRAPVAAINKDNSYGERLLGESKVKTFSTSKSKGDYFSREIKMDGLQTLGSLSTPSGEMIPIRSKLTGDFNLDNILGAMGLAHAMGVDATAISRGIENLEYVPGRLQRVESKLPFQVFVDFAHMGAALENVLGALRSICQGRLIVVFGAGGDRDPTRRVQLGQVAARLADHAVITSDNPRTEDPLKIIATVQENFEKEVQKNPSLRRSFEVEPDRRLAIQRALLSAKKGDVICITGKGHETGQIIGKQEFPFDDREEAQRILRQIEVDSHRET